ncbi:MAG: hypothetical protein L0Y72_12575 [Gemmataceae bacterium]|nr:hypothetical protein [Gemmataceae bacterium]MCI0739873.1 hypothetical protein [Gemmataceae bacterium]
MKAVLVVALGVLVYGGYCLYQSPKVRREAAAVPRMTCAELIKNGSGNHRYVALTDAWLDLGESVSQGDRDTGALEMYHPLYPANLKEQPAPRDLELIVCIMDELERRRIRDVRNEQHRLGQTGLGELTGAITKGDALPGWARQSFALKYPGIVLDRCWIITVGEYEPTELRASKLLNHGVMATLAAVAMMICWWVWRRYVSKPRIRDSHARPFRRRNPHLPKRITG